MFVDRYWIRMEEDRYMEKEIIYVYLYIHTYIHIHIHTYTYM